MELMRRSGSREVSSSLELLGVGEDLPIEGRPRDFSSLGFVTTLMCMAAVVVAVVVLKALCPRNPRTRLSPSVHRKAGFARNKLVLLA